MEQSPSARYTPHNSTKRVFSGTSSGSSPFMDAEIVQLDPPFSSKSSKGKQKEVIVQEIIDIDDDDDDDDVMVVDEKIVSSNKGKQAMTNGQEAFSSNMQAMAGGQEDSSSDMIILDDYYGDMAFEDAFYDDECAMLQAHFDSVDIPPGVEAPVPWWPSQAQAESKKQFNSTSSSYTNLQTVTDESISEMDQPKQWKTVETSPFPKPLATTYVPTFLPPWSSPGFNVQPGSGSMFPYGQEASFPPLYPPPFFVQQYPPGPSWATLSDSSFTELAHEENALSAFESPDPIVGGDPKQSPSGFSSKPKLPALPPSTMMPYLTNGSVRLEEGIVSEITVPSDLLSSGIGDANESPILGKLEQFKKFDTVLDHSDHYYANKKNTSRQPPKNWAKKIQDEWRILEKDLPDTIFVRVYETRIDLMRAAIMGANGTPYHDGLFFFDIYFPSSYPDVPPNVYYHSGGLRLNPNLYECGKVCLSLLNTWSGDANQKWIPGFSTMLQVLVSIQGLILNAEPYFNEPGYQRSMGSAVGEKRSKEYSENTFLLSLKTMLYSMRRPPKHFEDLVFGHFFKHAHDILRACRAYLGGTEVGKFDKGADEEIGDNAGNTVCSQNLKMNLPSYIKSLVEAFTKIGVDDCERFIVPIDEAAMKSGHSSGCRMRMGGLFNPFAKSTNHLMAGVSIGASAAGSKAGNHSGSALKPRKYRKSTNKS